MVNLDGLEKLVPNRENRIEGGLGVLQDHRQTAPPDVPHFAFAFFEKVFAVQQDPACHDAGNRTRHQAQQGQGGHALAAAGLPHDPQRFTLAQVKADAIDRLYHAPACVAVGAQGLDLQDRVAVSRRDSVLG